MELEFFYYICFMPYLTNKKTRKDIDTILEKIQSLQSGMGTDTQPEERKRVEDQQLMMWYEIKVLDEQFYIDAFLVGE